MPRKIGRFNFDSAMKTEWSEGFHAWQSVITKYYQVLMRGRQIIVDRFNAVTARLISELHELTKA